MSIHLTEEEQIETLKRWWRDYGKLIITAIVIAVAAYFGITEWKKNQQQKAEQASVVYEQLLQAVSVQPGQTLDAEKRSTVNQLANQLKSGGSGLYAHNAALFLARLAVEEGNLEQAATELKWVLDNKPAAATEQVARLRLARVLIANNQLDEAEKLLANPAAAFKSEYAEVQGDIFSARGDVNAARASYEQALADNDVQQQERSMLLQLKLDDLKLAPAASASAENAQ